MRIHFGFENPSDDATRLAPGLFERGINMNKAVPWDVSTRGLYKIRQIGYESYTDAIAAYMEASVTRENVLIGKEGYGISTRLSQVIPTRSFEVEVVVKNKNDMKAFDDVGEYSFTGQTKKGNWAYSVTYKAGMSKILKSLSTVEHVPSQNIVGAQDLDALITCLRIFSAFFRTHLYPAFKSDFEYEREIEERETTKRKDLGEEDNFDADGFKKWKYMKTSKGAGVRMEEGISPPTRYIRLRYAKPSEENLPWGSSGDVPISHGINFPYVQQLAKWDKDTVPRLMNDYFLKCFSTGDTSVCYTNLGEFTKSWKSSLFKTHIGMELTHMAKCIEIGMPAQARIFPVLDGNMYKGCSVIGYGFSVGIQGKVYPAGPLTAIAMDFEDNASIAMKIKQVCYGGEEFNERASYVSAASSLRGVDKLVKSFVMTPLKMSQVRTLASNLTLKAEPRKINMDNIEWLLEHVRNNTLPREDEYMSTDGIGEMSSLGSCLSAFGPLVPSPMIPAGPKLTVTDGLPEGFNQARRLVFKQCGLHAGIDDWRKFLDSGIVYNGVTNLAARFQHVKVAGDKERDRFFRVLYKSYKDETAKKKRVGQVLEPTEVMAALNEEDSADDEF